MQRKALRPIPAHAAVPTQRRFLSLHTASVITSTMTMPLQRRTAPGQPPAPYVVQTDTVTAEGTKKTLPSWYDEHPGIPLNVATGNQIDGSLEAYFDPGQFNWDSYADGCWNFDYNATMEYVGIYAEGHIYHGYLYK